MKPIQIAGGGLAGLSLARMLARNDVPVTLYEKSSYPRHKVCGEFITGLRLEVREALDLNPILDGSLEHRSSAWFFRQHKLFTRELPQVAIGISRWELDRRLVDAARDDGVEVVEGLGVRSFPEWEQEEGWIDTAGVSRGKATSSKASGWIGLKIHCEDYSMDSDLELHLGERAYAGMSRVEKGRTNICMLLHASACAPKERRSIESALDAVGLSHLARRLEGAKVLDETRSSTAGVAMSRSRSSGKAIVLGDGLGMIPPFTGHGMSMAFESAAIALDPLLNYCRGLSDWKDTRMTTAQRLSEARNRKLRWASRLHPFLLNPILQRMSAAGSKLPFFPWRQLYSLTH